MILRVRQHGHRGYYYSTAVPGVDRGDVAGSPAGGLCPGTLHGNLSLMEQSQVRAFAVNLVRCGESLWECHSLNSRERSARLLLEPTLYNECEFVEHTSFRVPATGDLLLLPK